MSVIALDDASSSLDNDEVTCRDVVVQVAGVEFRTNSRRLNPGGLFADSTLTRVCNLELNSTKGTDAPIQLRFPDRDPGVFAHVLHMYHTRRYQPYSGGDILLFLQECEYWALDNVLPAALFMYYRLALHDAHVTDIVARVHATGAVRVKCVSGCLSRKTEDVEVAVPSYPQLEALRMFHRIVRITSDEVCIQDAIHYVFVYREPSQQEPSVVRGPRGTAGKHGPAGPMGMMGHAGYKGECQCRCVSVASMLA